MAVPTISLVLAATITRAELPALRAALAERLRGPDAGVVVCDVAAVTRPDVVTVEALLLACLTARRHGRRTVVTGARPELLRLIGLLGLSDVLLQVGGQAEVREQAGRVEEVVDRRDPPG
ncbi:STAS domain-containing protein [Couchioplanes azureus]|uniref:STAS domain-containing protein n=1 Tax=Couchioplanes caeruleus TaxID=56438 RepID=UPI00167112EC|nr:STAS domain-containing protein [Couchioplanes caeruleus]GGQ71813.1 hypothetical protein GCM10010166_47480 [Couchioplanes caeruleus subsp. azureus]